MYNVCLFVLDMEDVGGECEETDWLSQSNGLQVAVKEGGIALPAPPSRCTPSLMYGG